ncbi:uncharacterized protein LOC134187228 [Corticium candelabrum]|uniref:uncharacterized protein LOC134187228 n=1 Tax=Corticium candelabrum TaxID=121492 RepID=UPI002E25FF15|nr:uncharacterized protein LOC134187228 [Corticium candelabrum]
MATAVDRTSVGVKSGVVFFSGDVSVGVLAYATSGELVNTAVLSGRKVASAVTVLSVYSNSSLHSCSAAVCRSKDVDVIQADVDCREVFVNGSESRGSSAVLLSVTCDNQTTTLPMQVWYPILPLQLTLEDKILNELRGTQSSTDGCHVGHQSTRAFVQTRFEAGNLLTDLFDVTSHATLNSSNSSVVFVDGVHVVGRSVGAAAVEVFSTRGDVVANTSVIVSDSPVFLAGLDISVVSELRVSLADGPYNRLTSQTVTIDVERTLEFEGNQAFVSVVAVLSDNSRMSLPSSVGAVDILVSSLDDSILTVDGQNIVARGSGNGRLLQVQWRLSECSNASIIDQTVNVSVNVPQPDGAEVSEFERELTTVGDLAVHFGYQTSTRLTIRLIYNNAREGFLDVSTDSRTLVEDVSLDSGLVNMTRTTSGQWMVSSNDAGRFGVATLNVRFSHVDVNINISITVIGTKGLVMYGRPYPEYPGSSNRLVTSLRPIGESGFMQRVAIAASLELTHSVFVDVSSHGFLRVNVSASSESLTSLLSVSNESGLYYVVSVVRAGEIGNVSVNGQFLGVHSSRPLMIALMSEAVYISSIFDVSVGRVNGSHLVGVKDEYSVPIYFSLSFDDGSQYVEFVSSSSGPALPRLVTFSSSNPDAVSVNPVTGVATLKNNSIAIESIVVSATNSSASSSVSFACNLMPSVGDGDIGALNGLPFPSLAVATVFIIPLRINSGSLSVGSLDIRLYYDYTILEAIDVTPGSSWPSSAFFVWSTNDPRGQIQFGGSVDNDKIKGSSLHIANVKFKAISTGRSVLYAEFLTFAERSLYGQSIGPPTPRDFVAGGNLMVEIVGLRTKRSDTRERSFHRETLYKRSSDCSFPPCGDCPSGDVPGDTDGTCVFDMRDISYILTYLSETAVAFSGPFGHEIKNTINSHQLENMDADKNGVIDTRDAYYLARLNFNFLRFVNSINVSEVGHNDCWLTITVALESRNTMSAEGNKTSIALIFEDNDPDFNKMFDSSVVRVGNVLRVAQEDKLNGRVVLCHYIGLGRFQVSFNTSINKTNIGLSILQVTFNDLGMSSVARTAFIRKSVASSVALYPPIRATLSVMTLYVDVIATNGYNPLLKFNNTITTSDCLTVPKRPLVFAYQQPLLTSVGGALLLSPILSHGPLNFTTNFTVLSLQQGAFDAAYGNATSSTVYDVATLPASSVSAYILNDHMTVWEDDRDVRVALQVRDRFHSVRTSTDLVAVRITRNGALQNANCRPNAVSGLCTASLPTPLSWFPASGSDLLTVTYSLPGHLSESVVGHVTLGAKTVRRVNNNVIVILPQRTLYRGNTFKSAVSGRFWSAY